MTPFLFFGTNLIELNNQKIDKTLMILKFLEKISEREE